MKLLLRLPHWQIFLLSWGPLMTVLVVLFKFPDLILTYFPFALALFLIGLANSFAWVWVIVHELKKTVKSINTKLFNIAFWIPFIYIWSIIGFILFNLFVRKVKKRQPAGRSNSLNNSGSTLRMLYHLRADVRWQVGQDHGGWKKTSDQRAYCRVCFDVISSNWPLDNSAKNK